MVHTYMCTSICDAGDSVFKDAANKALLCGTYIAAHKRILCAEPSAPTRPAAAAGTLFINKALQVTSNESLAALSV
jgi:hypothetical protein